LTSPVPWITSSALAGTVVVVVVLVDDVEVVDVTVLEVVEVDPGCSSPMAAVVQPTRATTQTRVAIGKREVVTGEARVNVMWE
jgi:hypothetical protein